ncbi:MAG: outer membrane protein transport protein [Thiobacillus sp.]|nr:outer membrane protein transport protein [Thiobacillus sp.]
MNLTRVFAFMALAGLAGSAYATNGYFSHGYGMKAKGMGGAATATHDDAFFGANNPAAAAFAGNRIDLGADLFSPIREYTRVGGALPGSAESESNYFLVPEFGYNRMVNSNLALGVTVYGNGGMNTDYPASDSNLTCASGPNKNMLCGSGSLGVDLMQLIVAPTAAFKVNASHSIGISPLLGYQRFKAEGLDAFAQISTDPNSLTNEGYDDSFGYGVRVGYMGKITPTVTIGAAYASKMRFEEFDKYKGLFAEQGDFDIPSNWNLGVAWQATPAVKLALDYQRINYSDVASVSNTSQPAGCVPNPPVGPAVSSTCLGGASGIGFGWQDIDVWKLGVEYKYSQNLMLRGGFNHGDNPIGANDVVFNSIAPGVIENHVTLGFTYTLATGNELTMSYMHGFANDVVGADNAYFPTGSTNNKIEMYQNAIGIQYSWKM